MGNSDSQELPHIQLGETPVFDDLYSSSLIMDHNHITQHQFDSMLFNLPSSFTQLQPNPVNTVIKKPFDTNRTPSNVIMNKIDHENGYN